MKTIISTILFLFFMNSICLSQMSCEELVEYVKSEDRGKTYRGITSTAINKVSFHEISDASYNTYYFAIVQFTSSRKEYIYQVARNTKRNYSYDYITSEGEAFWNNIQPYADVLGCSPQF